MSKIKSNKLVVLIFLIGFFVRILGIDNHPSGFTPDEASFGYDAYSILNTGRDQWGNLLPLSLRSFGDFKLPLYTYLTIPSVAIFGLNEFATRLPNALIGSFAVLTVYFMVLEVLKKQRIAAFSMFLFAISPWHILLSRGAFEANLTTFFAPLAILFFYKGIKNNNYLILSALFFGLNLFSYHSARLLTPLLLAALVWEERTAFKKSSYKFIFSAIVLLFIAISVLVTFQGGGSRISTSAIFNPTGGWGQALDNQYKATILGEPAGLARIFNNKFVFLISQFSGNYLSYFSPQFLVTNGPAEGTYGMVPGIGVIYFFELIFIIGFLIKSIKNEGDIKLWLIIWLFISPLAASITKGPGYAANRAAFMMPAIQIISAIGGLWVFENLSKKLRSENLRIIYIFVIVISFIFFLQNYIFWQKAHQSKAMIYGVRELVTLVDKIDKTGNFDEIIVSKRISEPHMYFAFFKKIEPSIVQRDSVGWMRYEYQNKDWVDQLDLYKLDKYIFKSIDTIADFKKLNVIIIGEPQEFGNMEPDFIINYPDFKPAYYVFVIENSVAYK